MPKLTFTPDNSPITDAQEKYIYHLKHQLEYDEQEIEDCIDIICGVQGVVVQELTKHQAGKLIEHLKEQLGE